MVGEPAATAIILKFGAIADVLSPPREERRDSAKCADVHAWELLLAQPLGNVVEEITSESSQAAELRQNSPFNGLLGQAIWKELVAEIKEDARAASS